MKKVIFKIDNINLLTSPEGLLGNYLIIDNDTQEIKYKILDYLGKGTVGRVYALEILDDIHNKFVIKISNPNCETDLKSEIGLVNKYFGKFKINHCSKPIYWGAFEGTTNIGVIYPYLGFYNLDTIRSINYKLTLSNIISIIKQIINQLIELKYIIHGDLKSSNIVIDKVNDNIKASIIDFGLIKSKSETHNIISTNYVTSPESIFSIDKYSDCLVSENHVNYSKHDYYGLYSIILDLLSRNGYWHILSSYLVEQIKLNSKFILNHSAVDIFVYVYHNFFFNNDFINISYKKLINKIEIYYPGINEKNFNNFDYFFGNYIIPNIDYTKFNPKHLILLKDFLINICHFNPNKRKELEELLKHPFLDII